MRMRDPRRPFGIASLAMNIAIVCIAIASFLPVACAGIAKQAGMRAGKFNNHTPREWLAKQTGAAARANAAQANSWEALPVFAAGVLSAEFLQVPQGRIDMMAMAFIACRIAYIALYVGDAASLRSVAWFAGYGISLALFVANMF